MRSGRTRWSFRRRTSGNAVRELSEAVEGDESGEAIAASRAEIKMYNRKAWRMQDIGHLSQEALNRRREP
jgi:hypothetical protein